MNVCLRTCVRVRACKCVCVCPDGGQEARGQGEGGRHTLTLGKGIQGLFVLFLQIFCVFKCQTKNLSWRD